MDLESVTNPWLLKTDPTLSMEDRIRSVLSVQSVESNVKKRDLTIHKKNTTNIFRPLKFRPFNLYLNPLILFYLYLMSTDQMGLNLRIEGEIRHQSVANEL